MTFDAGAIEATLRLRRDLWRSDLREAQAEGDAFARKTFTAKVDIGVNDVKKQFDEIRRGYDDLRKHIGGTGGPGGGLPGAPNTPGGFFGGLLRGIGPSIFGVGLRPSLLAAGGAVGLAGLPALLGPAAGLGVGVGGIGVAALFARELIGTRNVSGQPATQGPLYAAGQQAMQALKQGLQSAAAPLLQPLRQLFSQIPGLIRGITPDIRQFIGGAATLIQPFVHGLTDIAKSVLPGLGQAFRAASPLLRPLLDGLGSLVKGILPGLVTLLHASEPAVRVFAGILATLGRDLGAMFRIMAPALRESGVVLKAVFDLVGALLPVIGRLAKIFAEALGPVITVFVGAIKSILPALTIIGKVLGAFAAAVLKDLGGAFQALGRLIKDIAPGLTVVANVLSHVFNVLENTGVFATLGVAIEKTVGPLAQLINALLVGLAPILPSLVTLLSQLVNVGVNVLVTAIQVLVPIGIELIRDVLGPLLPTIRVLVPIINAMAQALGTGLGAILRALAPTLRLLAPWILGVVLAVKAWSIAQAILNIALDANPIGLIALAVAGLIIGITLLVTHWKSVWSTVKSVAGDAWHFLNSGWGLFLLGPLDLIIRAIVELGLHWHQIWNAIKTAASDAWSFLTHGWGQFLIPGLYLIRKGIEFLSGGWRTAWNDIRNAALSAWHFIDNNIVHPIVSVFTNDIPNAFRTAVRVLGNVWGTVERIFKAPVSFLVNTVYDSGIARLWNDVMGHIGGPKLPLLHFQRGGFLPGYGGGDQHPALLEAGETVIDKDRSRILAPLFKMMGVPGYQSGGITPQQSRFGSSANASGLGGSGLPGVVGDVAKIIAALFTGNNVAAENAFTKLFHTPAQAQLATMMLGIPKKIVETAVHWAIGLFSGGSGITAKLGGGPFGPIGGGVQRWAPLVLRVLRMLGQPLGDLGVVLSQMTTESGGNPYAINLTDSNAQAGDPSRGLMQTIMSTFLAYAGPFRSLGIYNPLANIYAGLNYAIHRYGAGWTSVLGHGHGYQKGGTVAEHIYGVGAKTGQHYQFHAGEDVIPGGLGAQIARMVERLDKLIALADKAPARTAAGIGDAITRSGRRGAYTGMYRG